MSKPCRIMIGGTLSTDQIINVLWFQRIGWLRFSLGFFSRDCHRASSRLRVCAREPHGHAECSGRGDRSAPVPVVHWRWKRCMWGMRHARVSRHYCHYWETFLFIYFEKCVFGEQIRHRLGIFCLGKHETVNKSKDILLSSKENNTHIYI